MEDYKYKLSIIIPMYNAEEYIGNCLDSILNSDLPQSKYEILIVNDGSTDKSEQIVQSYIEKYYNISYLYQENQGQSTARNYGITTCKGEYVWCVDADDRLITPELPKIFQRLCKNEQLDILGIQLQEITEEGKNIKLECVQELLPHHQIISGKEAVIHGYNPSSICALIVKKQLFIANNIFFVKGITHQDVELTYRLMSCAHKVLFSEITPYFYIQHANSTSNSLNPTKKIKYLTDDIYIINSFLNLSKQFATSHPRLATVIKNRSRNVLFSMVYSLYVNRKTWGALGINKAVIQKMKENNLYPINGKFDSWKKTLFVHLILNRKWMIK